MTRRITGLFFALLLSVAATGCEGVPDTCIDAICEDGDIGTPPAETIPPTPHPPEKLAPSGLEPRAEGDTVRADLRHAPFQFSR